MANYIGQPPVFGDFPNQVITATGISSYILTFNASSENGVAVFLNGAVQRPGIDFTLVGNNLTFTSAVASGVQIFVQALGLPKSSLAPSAGSVGDATLSSTLKADRLASHYSKLRLSATGLSALVTITANHLALLDDSYNQKVVRNVNLTALSLAAAGANGLDTGASAVSTWYSVWVIYNPTTATTAGLFSLSETAPTMPAGFTYKLRVGWVRSDATAGNKFPLSFSQNGQKVQYKVAAGSNVTNYPLLASGVNGSLSTPTWVGVAVAAFVPVTAVSIGVTASIPPASSSTVAVSPNNAIGAMNTTTNRPFMIASSTTTTASYGSVINGTLTLESAAIYVAMDNAGQVVQCTGWEDEL